MRHPRTRNRTLAFALTTGLTSTIVFGAGASQALADGEAVRPVMTTADQSKLLEAQPDVAFQPGSGSGTIIEVDDTRTHQTMDGFGASFTDSSAWLVANQLDADQRDTLMTNLFDEQSGIGLSLLRQPMGASDFTANNANYTYDDTCCDLSDFSIAHDQDYIIPVLKQAKAISPGLKLMATPWSPPAWMKTSDSLNGGQLKPDSHGVFADYFVEYVQAYAAEGLPIYALSPQNEPHHEASYPSMRMEPAEQAAVVANELGPAFAENGIDTLIMAWDHNWDEPGYPIQVLDDPAAREYVAGSAFHCYAGDVTAQSEVHNAYPGKDLWFTECSGGEWSTDFGENLKWNTQNLIIGATRNWAKGVTLWNMALDENHGPTNGGCTDCRGVVTVGPNGNVTYNVEYYVLGHASKFVRPGAERIESTTHPGDVESVAFRNTDGSIALIALNAGTAAKTFAVQWQGQAFEYELPAGAVATFTWSPSA